MTSKVKGQGRDVTWCVWQKQQNWQESCIPRAILHTSFRVKKSKVKVTKPTNYETESVVHIFRIGRLTKFKLGTQMEQAAPSSPKLKVKVAWSIWQVLAHKSITKSPRNTKIGRKVAHPTRVVMRTRFEVKRSRSPGRLMLKPKVCRALSTTNFKLGRRLMHALSTAMASYKGLSDCEVG